MPYKEAYYRKLVEAFIKKVYKRAPGSNKRPCLKPSAVYEQYDSDNRDLEKKHAVDSAAGKLEREGIVSVERLAYSSDILKVYLEIGSFGALEEIAKSLGIVVKDDASNKVDVLVQRYTGLSPEIDDALSGLRKRAAIDPSSVDTEAEELVLKGASFIVRNRKALYMREASCLEYGYSKEMERFEAKLCALLKTDSLERYNVAKPDPLIQLRGRVDIHLANGSILHADALRSGIGLRAGDIDDSCRIVVRDSMFLTVENQVSYLRHRPDDTAMMFLSGFANSAQIRLMKRVRADNPNLKFLHFGDIDAGGLRILEHLRKETGIAIEPYHMGIEELKDASPEISFCLRPLENEDEKNLRLMEGEFPDLAGYMIEHNCKLEQEIVSLKLEDACGKV